MLQSLEGRTSLPVERHDRTIEDRAVRLHRTPVLRPVSEIAVGGDLDRLMDDDADDEFDHGRQS